MFSRKNLIVPVFIPHRGCPHTCVFCNQNNITGNVHAPTPEEVGAYLSEHLSPDTRNAVVAFYGGSFTALPRHEQEGYLMAAGGFVEKGWASGIRLSTRPDCVDHETVGFLKTHGVRVVELGIQSMDDEVLAASGRGHNARDSVKASRLVRSAGLELGIQIMAGLPGDTPEKLFYTIKQVISLNPHFIRLYPCLVVKSAPLESLWRSKRYAPLGLDEAAKLCAGAVEEFREAGVNVVRVGLQPTKELETSLLAGPYHPAFGHLVDSELAYRRMSDALVGQKSDHVEFLVNQRELSTYLGIKRENIARLGRLRKGLNVTVRADSGVEEGGLELRVS